MASWLTPDMITLLTRGIVLTLIVSGVTTVGALVLGITAGAGRMLGNPLIQRLSILYIEVHRNIPALVLVIFWAFAVPNIFPRHLRQAIFFNNAFWDGVSNTIGIPLPYYLFAGTLGLTLNTSGYLAEQFRAGVSTIQTEQFESARTLGATRGIVFWQMMLPEGLIVAFPAIATRLIHNFKNTALLSLVAVPIFFHGIQTAISKTFRATEFLLLAAAVYLVLTAVFAQVLRILEGRFAFRQAHG